MIKVKVTLLNQHAGAITVTDESGQIHTGRWNNNEEIYNVTGSSTILKAAMHTWGSVCAADEYELTQDELEQHGGGWWTYPKENQQNAN